MKINANIQKPLNMIIRMVTFRSFFCKSLFRDLESIQNGMGEKLAMITYYTVRKTVVNIQLQPPR